LEALNNLEKIQGIETFEQTVKTIDGTLETIEAIW
jgi:hypothetical protein